MRSAVVATFALFAALGCTTPKVPRDAGVPTAATLLTDLVSAPLESRTGAADSYELPADGALYVVDATGARVVYSGAVKAGEVLKLTWGEVGVSSRKPALAGSRTQTRIERHVARYDAGRRYRVYYHPNAAPEGPTTSDEGSPLTRPFEVRERTLDPTRRPPPG